MNDEINDSQNDDLEEQIEKASNESQNSPTDREEKTSKDGEGLSPDLGTAKDQLNREDGIEIL